MSTILFFYVYSSTSLTPYITDISLENVSTKELSGSAMEFYDTILVQDNQ